VRPSGVRGDVERRKLGGEEGGEWGRDIQGEAVICGWVVSGKCAEFGMKGKVGEPSAVVCAEFWECVFLFFGIRLGVQNPM